MSVFKRCCARGSSMEAILCFNRGHERPRPALFDHRAGRALREHRHCRASGAARRVPRPPRTSRTARCRNRATHPASRLSGSAVGATRARSQARHRPRRRRHHAVHRAATRRLRRTADRHQSGPPGLPDRHRARRHGERARGDARRRVCRGIAHLARATLPRGGTTGRCKRAGAQRCRRQSWRAGRHDRLCGDHRWRASSMPCVPTV